MMFSSLTQIVESFNSFLSLNYVVLEPSFFGRGGANPVRHASIAGSRFKESEDNVSPSTDVGLFMQGCSS